MKKEDFHGKKVSDFSEEGTAFLGGPYRKDFSLNDVELRDKKPDIITHTVTDGEGVVVETLQVVGDFLTGTVMCFKNDRLVAVWDCYDLAHINLNGKRGLVKSIGHETTEEYWFDDGEFSKEYTR